MKRFTPLLIAAIACPIVMALHVANNRADAQAFGSTHTPDALQSYAINMQPDPHGAYTPRGNFAAHEWHPGTDIPNRKDGEFDPITGKRVLRWPIVAQYPSGNPSIVWYGKNNPNDDAEAGRFRSSNWSNWGTPARWAYLRLNKEVWNPATSRMEVPGLPGSPQEPAPPVMDMDGVHMDAVQGQWDVDDLKRSFTVDEINRFLEASPYDEPDTGAPEDGPGSPSARVEP